MARTTLRMENTCKTSLRLIRRIGGRGRGCRTIVTNAIKPSPKHVQMQNSLQTASETHKQHFDQGYEPAAETNANITFSLQTASQTCQQHFNEAYKACQKHVQILHAFQTAPQTHKQNFNEGYKTPAKNKHVQIMHSLQTAPQTHKHLP